MEHAEKVEIAEAKQRAFRLDLDKIVRLVASNGRTDSAGCNSSVHWEGCEIKSSIAGMYSASVSCKGVILYHATNYGHCVEEFHDGSWVRRLRATSKEITQKADKQKQLDIAKKEAIEKAKFYPTEF